MSTRLQRALARRRLLRSVARAATRTGDERLSPEARWRRLVIAKVNLLIHERRRPHPEDYERFTDDFAALEEHLREADQLATDELRALGRDPPPSLHEQLAEEERRRQARNEEALRTYRQAPPTPPRAPLPEPEGGLGLDVYTAAQREALPQSQDDMLRVLCAWCDELGRVEVRHGQLADLLCVVPETVKNASLRLQARGWLRVVERPPRNATRKPWTYQLAIPIDYDGRTP